MAKEKNYNPVQAQRKADKAKAIKKGKSEVQDRRNEKLARKNPERMQKQIDDLKETTTRGGKLSKHEEQVLEGLEKELKAVKRAREAMGDKAPTFGRGWTRDGQSGSGGPGVLGKRRRGSNASSSDEDVPEDVKRIPMPRDTPPPMPKEVLDKWYAKRRAKREAENASRESDKNANQTELGKDRNLSAATPAVTPPVESRTTYEAKPIMRDLRKEAVSAFMPAAVQRKMDKGQGQGGLMEPDEADKLEKEGYLKATVAQDTDREDRPTPAARTVTVEEVEDDEA